ncbi:MAG: alanine racemase [Gammaproteobacteria bacterium]|nr:alanine racemase [Gammaproteobacteria bacterium]
MTRPARALIDSAALRHNFQQAKRAARGRKVMAVVKANAYGHGLVRVARALARADAFGVARLEEGLELRDAGVGSRIVLLSGVESAADLETARAHALDLVVHAEHQLAMLETAAGGPGVGVWLKLDTGMHRLGFPVGAAAELHGRLMTAGEVVGSVTLMTHLADADQRGSARVERQIADFHAGTAGIEAERSVVNSGGLLGWPASHGDWVRPGIMLYGISPFDGGDGADEGLKPVMTLETRLIAVNRVPRGGRLGYGGTYTCPEDMPVGVAAVGYGDGYPRHADSGTPVLVNGVRCPLAGRVSMDMITVDLRPLPSASPGDRVVLWGAGLAAEEVASGAGTIAYELLCRLPPRVQYVESDG